PMSDDRDPVIEQQLRDALRATADTVQPGGDGLMRIQQRVGARTGRQRWLRPVLVLGSVIVVAAVAVGGVAIARHNNNNAQVRVGDQTGTSTPAPAEGFPAQGIFPFTNAKDEADWQQGFVSGGHSPWISDPEGVATSWVPYYLKAKNVDQVIDKQVTATTADVTLGRNASEGGLQPVVVVHLVKFDKAWIVTGASDPHNLLTISTPTAGSTVSSPLTVTGPGFGVDEVAKVELRDATTPTLISSASTDGFGNGTQQWSATLSYANPPSTAGVVVAMTLSAADGGVAQIAAEKVGFDQATTGTTSGGFYGVQGGVIERFAADGTPQGPVTGSESHGTVAEVHEVAGSLYYTAGTTKCPSSLYSMAADGGNSTTVANADAGFGITGFDVGASGRVVYFESGCGSDAGKGKLVVPGIPHRPGIAIPFASEPPVIEGDPVWEADGVHVDAFVRTGMQGYLARYDSTSGDNPTPTANACSQYDPATQLTGALATAPDGTLWFAGQTGSSMQVLSCNAGQPNVEYTVPVNGSPTSLAVDGSGDILLTDSDGKVFIGSPGEVPRELSIVGGASSATW
ncbi:MAG TPA: Gmad2 immunoglobulin-like domain-containing protein, partial [Mycobacteriales bacterium]|nr:Gmad2 immunoglobulin-like domain-containing protein [Mycobacteriales bacterium]